MPWCLTFHYTRCPEDQIVKLEGGLQFLKFNYINSLKEAHRTKLGSANEILSSLSKTDENKLLKGIKEHSYQSFWEINQSLNDKPLLDIKAFAIRIYCNKHHTYLQPCLNLKQIFNELIQDQQDQAQDENQVQSLGADFDVNTLTDEQVQLYTETINKFTVGQMLEKAFPALFEQELNEETGDLVTIKTKPFDIICHGVIIDMNTPLYWMQLNLGYLDNFIYLSFHIN